MTLVLLDTNVYLRLAKRIRPMLGISFGHKDYVITILKDVEDEVHRSSKLRFKNPWFDEPALAEERVAKRMKFGTKEREDLDRTQGVLHGWVLMNLSKYTIGGRSPPSEVDCKVLAFGQIRSAIVVTDDLGMHTLADEFNIPVWHGPELLAKLRSAKMVDNELVRSIYDALEKNLDTTQTWADAKHTIFGKVFGKNPEQE